MDDRIPDAWREDEEIIRLTIEQIRKDLGSGLPELVFSGDPSSVFEELTLQLTPYLKSLYQTGYSRLQGVLYRVDITGRDRQPYPAHYFEELARRVIRREFQKVLTRKFHSKRG